MKEKDNTLEVNFKKELDDLDKLHNKEENTIEIGFKKELDELNKLKETKKKKFPWWIIIVLALLVGGYFVYSKVTKTNYLESLYNKIVNKEEKQKEEQNKPDIVDPLNEDEELKEFEETKQAIDSTQEIINGEFYIVKIYNEEIDDYDVKELLLRTDDKFFMSETAIANSGFEGTYQKEDKTLTLSVTKKYGSDCCYFNLSETETITFEVLEDESIKLDDNIFEKTDYDSITNIKSYLYNSSDSCDCTNQANQ